MRIIVNIGTVSILTPSHFPRIQFRMSHRRPTESGWLAYYRGLIGAWAKGNTLRHDAEDAAQDAIIGMLGYERAGILDAKAYLYQTSLNRLRNEVRRQSRHELLPLEDLAEDDHPLLSDPEASFRTQELIRALERALERLPLKKRQAYIYHRLEGYTQSEVAKEIGVALNTVERYIMDATREIREQLQDFCPK